MTTIATLAVKLIADAAGFITTMDQAGKKTQTWAQDVSKNLKNVGSDITNVGSNATRYLTLPILAAGAAAVNYASRLQETKSKTKVIFGAMADDMFAWSSTAATSFGQSQRQALDAASNFAIFGNAAGLADKDLMKFAQTNTELASDLASFFDSSPEEAIVALGAAFRGETEPIRKYGVLLNESNVALKAMQLGLVETTVDMVRANGLTLDAERAQTTYNSAVKKYGEESLQAREAAQRMAEIQQNLDETMAGSSENISDAVKIQARYALIMDQTVAAQGDYKRTAEGVANQTRGMSAQFEDAAGLLGEQLLPYALQLIQWISQAITWFQALNPEQQRWIVGILAVIAVVGPLLVVLGMLVSAVGAVIGVIGAITTPVLIVIAVIAALIAIAYLAYEAWTNNWGGIRDVTKQVMDQVKATINAALNFIAPLIAAWTAARAGDWYSFGYNLGTFWRNAWTAIQTTLENAKEILSGIMESAVTRLQDVFFGTDWSALGAAIAQGIAEGLTNALDALIEAAIALAMAALEAALGFIGGWTPPATTPPPGPGPQSFGGADTPGLRSAARGMKRSGGWGGETLVLNNYGTIVTRNLSDLSGKDLQRAMRMT